MSHTTSFNGEQYIRSLIHNGDWSGNVVIVYDDPMTMDWGPWEVSIPGELLLSGQIENHLQFRAVNYYFKPTHGPGPMQGFVPEVVLFRAVALAVKSKTMQDVRRALEDL